MISLLSCSNFDKPISGNLKLAERMCNELGGLASTAMGVDMELKVEASLREARTLLAAKQYGQVCSISLLTICSQVYVLSIIIGHVL